MLIRPTAYLSHMLHCLLLHMPHELIWWIFGYFGYIQSCKSLEL